MEPNKYAKLRKAAMLAQVRWKEIHDHDHDVGDDDRDDNDDDDNDDDSLNQEEQNDPLPCALLFVDQLFLKIRSVIVIVIRIINHKSSLFFF